MTVFNIGSINIDHLYQVGHFVRPGETLASTQYQQLLGGKGANQSIAIARAGGQVCHVGAVFHGDDQVLHSLNNHGVDTSLVAKTDTPTGHAIIQLTPEAENAIILYPGANHSLTQEQISGVLAQTSVEDWVLLQNETNLVLETLQQAAASPAQVAFNPAPMDLELTRAALSYIDLLVVNEVEAMDLTRTETIEAATTALEQDFPQLSILLTLGKDGVRYISHGQNDFVPAFKVEAVDTTAAGDTFIGFYLAALSEGKAPNAAMTIGCAASALCVTRLGAADAIPTRDEVNQFLAEHPTASL